MSGYRSLKRVLGETNLERKCRWLFGICVGGLILLAFWWVDWIAEDLIASAAQFRGQAAVSETMINVHWQKWTTKKEDQKTQEQMVKALSRQPYQATLLKIDNSPQPLITTTVPQVPQNDFEKQLLRRLKDRAETEFAASRAATATSEKWGGTATPPAAAAPPRVFEAFPVTDRQQYYYYEVVYWSENCINCHLGLHGQHAESAAFYDGSVFDASSSPFRVVRVTMPYQQTRAAIDYTRAILLTVGIVTVSLSMLALWMVVRYVVVKPLTHLRDVSESVAEGDLAQRADIHTGDEFEDLASSFNKMLRHLIETQGELLNANQQLDGKVDELARLNMQLHEMNRLKGEYLATMSHELRTPLNSIIGFSEVLQNIDSLSDKQKRYVRNIQKGGRDLLEMINDILDLEKMEAGKMEVRPSEFRIDNVIHTQCDLVRTLADDKNIDLSVEIDKDLPLLFQDQPKVQQILMNLLSNAIKFTPEGGRITVGARGDSRGRIEFWVADTGVGIPASEKEIIFEKFRQGKAVLGRDNLAREYSGTGLGLSIVKELCKLLGGEVTVESELGKGSTFRVVIPWMRADLPAAQARLSAKLDELSKPRRADVSLASGLQPAVAAEAVDG
ncbi:MAG: HAMP domain-containing sensor histidine kinase [Pirellulaceae bacterium]